MDSTAVTRWALLVVAFALMIGGFILAYRGDAAAAATTYVASVFCLVFAFLSQFKKFSGLGFMGETWEQKMEEADELISRLRGLAAVIAEPVFIAMARLGRWDSHLTRQERYNISTKLEAELKRNGVLQEEINRARIELDRVNSFDMAKPIFDAAYRKIGEKVAERYQVIQGFTQPITALSEHAAAVERWREASESQQMFTNIHQIEFSQLSQIFLDRLAVCSIISLEEKEFIRHQFSEEITDLKYYVENRKFRRADVWLRGEN